ncbi:hypothetical protein [Pseudomonas sp. NPDC089569]|uniref:hypothetical protein n=1 Tax=Pseudomonas sp. NPDC089569 TaxID=3390722 RepID=UPI003D05C8A3
MKRAVMMILAFSSVLLLGGCYPHWEDEGRYDRGYDHDHRRGYDRGDDDDQGYNRRYDRRDYDRYHRQYRDRDDRDD